MERDCDATTDFSTIVAMHAPSESYGEQSRWLFVVKGRHNVAVKWVGPHELQITCPDCQETDIYRRMIKQETVSLKYD